MANMHKPASGHEKIETSNFLMIVLILLAVAVGGLLRNLAPVFSLAFLTTSTPPQAVLGGDAGAPRAS